jgi:hypothetical protein
MWMSLASGRVKQVTQEQLARKLAELAAKMTPQELADGQRLAKEWKPSGK